MNHAMRAALRVAAVGMGCALSSVGNATTTIESQETRSTIGPISWLDEELDGARDIAELGDGNVVLTESRGRRVLLVDWKTKTAKQLGQIGDGPGEYRAVGDIFSSSDDTLLIVDPQARRLLRYENGKLTSGRFDSGSLSLMFSGPIVGIDERGRVAILRRGKLSPDVRRLLGPLAGSDYADSNWLVVASFSSPTIDTLTSLKGRMQGSVLVPRVINGVTFFLYDPFAAPDQAIMFKDGWIAVVRSSPYSVDWCRPDGRWIKGAPLPFRQTMVTDLDKRHALSRVYDSRSVTPEMIPSWTRVVPPFVESRPLTTPDGLLAIPRTVHASSSPGQDYDLIQRDGTKQRTVRVAPSVRIIGFGRRTVYLVRINNDGVEHLGRAAWPA